MMIFTKWLACALAVASIASSTSMAQCDSDTFHNIFALQTGVCAEKNVSQADCMAFASWLQSAVLAFLDFYLEGRSAAHTWLQNPYLKIASSGVAGLEKK